MSGEADVTAWIGKIKEGDQAAAQGIWEEYYDKLVRLARKKLDGMPRRAADEEDVALSAFNSFYQCAKAGRFPQLNDRNDLWKLLVTITVRKTAAQYKRHHAQKRGGGNVRGESIFIQPAETERRGGMEQVLGNEPTPELAAMVLETCGDLLEQLGDESLTSPHAIPRKARASATPLGPRMTFRHTVLNPFISLKTHIILLLI